MSGRQILVLCLAIAGALFIATCIGGVLFIRQAFKSPENIVFTIEAPLRVTSGDDFEIVVTIENTSTKPQTLVSIDVWDRYLEGIAIIASSPSFRQAFHIPIDNTVAYEFNREIPGNGSLIVTLSAQALAPGDYDSYIDACINSEVSYMTQPIRTLVEPETGERPVPADWPP